MHKEVIRITFGRFKHWNDMSTENGIISFNISVIAKGT